MSWQQPRTWRFALTRHNSALRRSRIGLRLSAALIKLAVCGLTLCLGHAMAQASDWTRMPVTTKPQSRSGAMMAYDSVRGASVMFGGIIASSQGPANLADTWIWDGSTWTEVFPVHHPSVRYNGAMFFHAPTGMIILFGGAAFSGGLILPLGDTWQWDGTDWTQLSPANTPSKRYDCVAAYDSSHGQGVLFGGFGINFLADTWTWDGADWNLLSTANAPEGRILPAFAFDSLHSQVVLFGGRGAEGYLNDTWLWDGSSWTQSSPPTVPPHRYAASMAFDSALGYSLMFGGFNEAGGQDDTWTWDGAGWTMQSPANIPTARFQFMMDYDALHQQVVMFGGTYGSRLGDIYLSDTWVW